MIEQNDITHPNPPWAEVSTEDFDDAFTEVRRWLLDSAIPLITLARKEITVCKHSKDAVSFMTGVIDLAREHAYYGARSGCQHVPQETFDDAWRAAVAEILPLE